LGLTPSGGHRTIRSLVQELGECKFVYDSHAFGDGSIVWEKGTVPSMPKHASPSEATEWLKGAHTALRANLAALADDASLTEEVRSQWGRMLPRRFLIKTVIEHDLYHCGEINHIRALVQGND
jgi:hypothetical protein